MLLIDHFDYQSHSRLESVLFRCSELSTTDFTARQPVPLPLVTIR